MARAAAAASLLVAALLACLLACSLSDTPNLAASCAVHDDPVQCSALRTFAIATGYATWGFNGGWLTGSTYCSWTGVACDPAGRDVVSLCGSHSPALSYLLHLPTSLPHLPTSLPLSLSPLALLHSQGALDE